MNRQKIEISPFPKCSDIDVIATSTNKTIRLGTYEKCRWPYILTLPFMWLIIVYVMLKKKIYMSLGFSEPHTNILWFDGLGKESRKVKEYATTWRAMDIIYNHPFPQRMTFRGLIDEFYWYSLNCQALRNRLKLIKTELRSAISHIDPGDEEIRILSLACGSAEASIEIIAEFKKRGKNIRALLVDIDQDALIRAENLARHYGVEDQIETRNESAYHLLEISLDFKPHIIEMLGLFDYISYEEVISLTKKIHQSLEPGGFFLTCNIAPNPEQYFLKWVINWPMIYRTPEDLAGIATNVGFWDYRLVYEPHEIHGLLIARKN